MRRDPDTQGAVALLSTAAAIGGPELLDIRVAQLEHGTGPTGTRSEALDLLGDLGVKAMQDATVGVPERLRRSPTM